MEAAKFSFKNEWKINLEYISMLMRNQKFLEAKKETLTSLEIHPVAGRLWAILIQIEHVMSNYKQAFKYFLYAIHEVPKSGEVW